MKRFLWAPLAALALVLSACPKKEKQQEGGGLPVLSEIKVNDLSRRDERVPGVTEETVRGWARIQLRSSKSVRLVDKAGPKVYRLRVDYGVGERDDEQVVIVEARGSVPDLDSVALQAAIKGELEQKTPSNVKKAVDTVIKDIVFQAHLATCPPKQLAKILESEKDAKRLAAAVGIAGVRRVRETVPPLIKLLKHESEEVADPAIGALVGIGDRRAVRPLTRLTKFSNTAKMAKLIDGIGSLGGKEAREFLEFVASGHDDADIRNMASEALERLKRRRER
jgi:hypothetical protein